MKQTGPGLGERVGVYIGYKPCGCVGGVVSNYTLDRENTDKAVAVLKERFAEVEYLPIGHFNHQRPRLTFAINCTHKEGEVVERAAAASPEPEQVGLFG